MATTPSINLGGIEQMVIGMTEEQARRTLTLNGISNVRVVVRDDESFPIAANYDSDRINLHIVNGKVIEVERG
jgi:hypothetical protein